MNSQDKLLQQLAKTYGDKAFASMSTIDATDVKNAERAIEALAGNKSYDVVRIIAQLATAHPSLVLKGVEALAAREEKDAHSDILMISLWTQNAEILDVLARYDDEEFTTLILDLGFLHFKEARKTLEILSTRAGDVASEGIGKIGRQTATERALDILSKRDSNASTQAIATILNNTKIFADKALGILSGREGDEVTKIIGNLGLNNDHWTDKVLGILAGRETVLATAYIREIAKKYPKFTEKGFSLAAKRIDIEGLNAVTEISIAHPDFAPRAFDVMDWHEDAVKYIKKLQEAHPQYTIRAMESMALYKDEDAIYWIAKVGRLSPDYTPRSLSLLAEYEDRYASDALRDTALTCPKFTDQILTILAQRKDSYATDAIVHISNEHSQYKERVFDILKQRKKWTDLWWIRSIGKEDPVFTERAVEVFLPSRSKSSKIHLQKIFSGIKPLETIEIIGNLTSKFNGLSPQQGTLEKIAVDAASSLLRPETMFTYFIEGRQERLKEIMSRVAGLSPQLKEAQKIIEAAESSYALHKQIFPDRTIP